MTEDIKPELGRPTLFTPEMLKKAGEYIDSCQDEEVENEVREGFTTYKTKVKLPTRGGMARALGVSRDTLYEWAKVHPTFSDIMEDLGAEQEDRLINSGLSGDYNPTISKVILTKHGYRDSVENINREVPVDPEAKARADGAIDEFLTTKP